MNEKEIANILYNMSLDMDYADYIEFAEEEISQIEKEIKLLKENHCDSLIQTLEIIAMQNIDMKGWHNNENISI